MEGAGVAVATSSACISRLPPAFFPSFNPKPSFFLTEHLQVVHSQLLKSGSVVVSDGSRKNRPYKTTYATDDRSSQEDERRMHRGSSSSRWSNQKRLLALFKHIETSISQEKVNQSDSNSSKAYNAPFDSVLQALQHSGKGDRISSWNKKASETDKETDPQPSPGVELKAVVESQDGGVEDEEPLELVKLKLTQLKEIAKARGIKGYSKMKKTELIDLLSSQPKS